MNESADYTDHFFSTFHNNFKTGSSFLISSKYATLKLIIENQFVTRNYISLNLKQYLCRSKLNSCKEQQHKKTD